MPDLNKDQLLGLKIAHTLVDLGAPVFPAAPDSSRPGEFLYPNSWQTWRPNHSAVDRWRPGWALAMVCGVVFDVLDIDPRNGGYEGFSELMAAGAWPESYGNQDTPSAGAHYLIERTHLAKGKPAQGIDLQAGDDRGEGRGFIFIAPTVRISKYGPNQGQPVAYRWSALPEYPPSGSGSPERRKLIDLATAGKPASRKATAKPASAPLSGDWDVPEDMDAPAAERTIQTQLEAVRAAKAGEVNGVLGGAARVLGRFVAGGWLDEEEAVADLLAALEAGGVHSDEWNRRNGLGWTAASVVAAGLDRGREEPWTVADPVPAAAPAEVDTSIRSDIGYPRLLVESPAVMSYWLAQEAGTGRLSGFFSQGGQIVHTPRVSELGYVPAPDGDSNGPVEIRPVTGRAMASKIQFLYSCYKIIKGKKEEPDAEVPAMFPIGAAEAIVNAPEAALGLRPLRGITHTPMVRADGSILDHPGYDKASGYLFIPGQGVNVPTVPERPGQEELTAAVRLLSEMVEGFPFATPDDRANYFGLLLTPLLRLVTPPSYKMFGIGAHQPGSGKSLLADTVGMIHGAVFRSETPEDEAEWRKMTMSLLSTTSAPVVVLDNVTGVLRSSVLAGLLTSSGEIQDRELGSSRMISTTNDRTWVVTGNNLSLGGDLVRRTVTILIDPDMANPETRMDFKIKDLPAWVKGNRNRLIHALLVLVRHWVAQGMPLEDRRQSDGFATWERAVGGILAAAGIAGRFDMESGKKASAGGDDDGLAGVLERMQARYGSEPWTVARAMEPEAGDWAEADRDWMPSHVLDRLTRGEARGRQAFGKWLRFRIGRWVTGSDGRAYVLREAGLVSKVQTWRVDVR